MKKYLYVTVTRKDGFTYPNPLKLSEVSIINQILKLENVESVKVEVVECHKAHYNFLFK